ncbi:MAG: hypothetical protein M3Q56_00580 [Bacteroidota bacterium]|nr:hypothetical protein [Bacteroidota bacterium]
MIHLVELGYIGKTHGFKGEVHAYIHENFEDYVLEIGVLFLNVRGNDIPFFIESHRYTDVLLLKFKEVDSMEAARLLTNKAIYLDESRFPKKIINLLKKEKNLEGLENFILKDINSQQVKEIISIEQFPSQLMATIKHEDRQLMIPIHEDWIVEINEADKIVVMNLPEGIFDL